MPEIPLKLFHPKYLYKVIIVTCVTHDIVSMLFPAVFHKLIILVVI